MAPKLTILCIAAAGINIGFYMGSVSLGFATAFALYALAPYQPTF